MFIDNAQITKLTVKANEVAAMVELARQQFLRVKHQRGHDSFNQAKNRWELLSDRLTQIEEEIAALQNGN